MGTSPPCLEREKECHEPCFPQDSGHFPPQFPSNELGRTAKRLTCLGTHFGSLLFCQEHMADGWRAQRIGNGMQLSLHLVHCFKSSRVRAGVPGHGACQDRGALAELCVGSRSQNADQQVGSILCCHPKEHGQGCSWAIPPQNLNIHGNWGPDPELL